jgi:hypothetical protein
VRKGGVQGETRTSRTSRGCAAGTGDNGVETGLSKVFKGVEKDPGEGVDQEGPTNHLASRKSNPEARDVQVKLGSKTSDSE